MSNVTSSVIATLQAADLLVSYQHHAVALELPALSISGNCIALLGHNGSGKSTLLKTLLQLIHPKRGELYATFTSTDDGGAHLRLTAQRDMAFCPEAGSVFLDVTVEEYLSFWGRLRLRDPKAHRSVANQALLTALGVAPLLRKLGRELSKGQRRRIHAAVGFLIQPRLFLFDEPFDGLDIRHASALVGCIERLRSTTAFVISSHRIDIVERLCDAAIVLRDGQLVTAGSLDEVTKALGGPTLSAGMMG